MSTNQAMAWQKGRKALRLIAVGTPGRLALSGLAACACWYARYANGWLDTQPPAWRKGADAETQALMVYGFLLHHFAGMIPATRDDVPLCGLNAALFFTAWSAGLPPVSPTGLPETAVTSLRCTTGLAVALATARGRVA
jgi:hypothetical protein